MKPRWEGFRSPIAAAIERYLAHKRALGCRFRTEEKALCLLDRFLVERGVKAIDEIDPELIEAFLASRPRTRPRSYNHLLCTVRRLYDWLVAQGDLPSSPVRTRPRRETSHRIPFLFNAEQARRLLTAAALLPDATTHPCGATLTGPCLPCCTVSACGSARSRVCAAPTWILTASY